jgi:hypothetical protein
MLVSQPHGIATAQVGRRQQLQGAKPAVFASISFTVWAGSALRGMAGSIVDST